MPGSQDSGVPARSQEADPHTRFAGQTKTAKLISINNVAYQTAADHTSTQFIDFSNHRDRRTAAIRTDLFRGKASEKRVRSFEF